MATRGGTRRRTRSPYRGARAFAYGTARTLGNWQPVWDFLGNGDLPQLVRNLTRRTLRRVVGRAWSRFEYGSGDNVIISFLLFWIGRQIGVRGRK